MFSTKGIGVWNKPCKKIIRCQPLHREGVKTTRGESTLPTNREKGRAGNLKTK